METVLQATKDIKSEPGGEQCPALCHLGTLCLCDRIRPPGISQADLKSPGSTDPSTSASPIPETRDPGHQSRPQRINLTLRVQAL